MSTSTILGVVVLARHGDRQGFYQNPSTYTPTATSITPVGEQQEYQLGQALRSLYLNATSSSRVSGLNATVDATQLVVRADAGGEGGVIFDSSLAVLQGMWPTTGTQVNTTLANGTTVSGPLNGYQYIPVESVEPNNDISLEGWTSCNTFNNATNAFYASPAFTQKKQENAAFFQDLPQYLDGRPATLENMWNIYDFMNVNYIHNAAFHQAVPLSVMQKARDLANYHEYGVFSSPSLSGIGNVAGQTLLPTILNGFSRISDEKDPVKFVYAALAYKPFLSLFNMTQVTQSNPQLAGIVEYAAAVALEVRKDGSGNVGIRFNFKNGTSDDFKTYDFMGSAGDVPFSTFVNTLAPAAINTTGEWCKACSNTQDRGCGALAAAAAASQPSFNHKQRISPVGAGFLGAGLTLAVVIFALAILFCLRLLTCGRKSRRSMVTPEAEGSKDEKAASV